MIERIAHKTRRYGRSIPIPLPTWLKAQIDPLRGWFGTSVFGFRNRKAQWRELKAIATAAAVPYVPPHGFRRYAINQWSAVDSLAGQLLHGQRIGVMAHYLDVGRHLAKHAPNVEMPGAFMPQDVRDQQAREEQALRDLYQRSSPQKRALMLSLAREIA